MLFSVRASDIFELKILSGGHRMSVGGTMTGRLLAPTMGRQQSEFLGSIVERELDLLEQIGWLPPMPAVLKAAGGLIDVDYSIPLNTAQRAE